MGEKWLFEIFLEEEIKDLQKAVLYDGIIGVFSRYENWLYAKGVFNDDSVSKLRVEYEVIPSVRL